MNLTGVPGYGSRVRPQSQTEENCDSAEQRDCIQLHAQCDGFSHLETHFSPTGGLAAIIIHYHPNEIAFRGSDGDGALRAVALEIASVKARRVVKTFSWDFRLDDVGVWFSADDRVVLIDDVTSRGCSVGVLFGIQVHGHR